MFFTPSGSIRWAMSTSTSAVASMRSSPTATRLVPPPIEAPTSTGRGSPSAVDDAQKVVDHRILACSCRRSPSRNRRGRARRRRRRDSRRLPSARRRPSRRGASVRRHAAAAPAVPSDRPRSRPRSSIRRLPSTCAWEQGYLEADVPRSLVLVPCDVCRPHPLSSPRRRGPIRRVLSEMRSADYLSDNNRCDRQLGSVAMGPRP